MKSIFVKLIAFFALLATMFVQAADPVLMKINGKPVLKSEFEYIYNKNNSNNSLDKKTLEEYVELFVNFKLKVEEAKAQGIDTTKSFINELAGYRSQLTKPYLTDAKVDEQVLQEAYNRMKEDVEVSHILIRIPQSAAPVDTLAAWKKINAIAKRLEKEDFAKVAKATSEDESAEQNGGYIGWISSFRTVYPFETMAYNTKVGTISKPVRTAFGYHIIKVQGRRNTLGEVLVSHIMRFTSQGDEAKNKAAKVTIDSIYTALKAGADFGKLASDFSEDRGSATKNGELPWFGTGRMVPEFETAAFALKNKGDISAPIQSAYGWHIIKLIDKKGIESFENMRADLEQKVKRDERANFGQKSFVAKLSKDYNFTVNTPNLDEFSKLLNNKSISDSVYLVEISKLNKPLFNIANKQYSQSDFAGYLKNNDQSGNVVADVIKDKFDTFVEKELLAYEDSQLEKKHDDFRFLINEYHDGILLFEVSNNEVWDKASKDTEGLSKYFNSHKSDYKWEKPHYKGRIIYCKDKETLKTAKSLIKNLHNDSIDKFLRNRLNDSIQYVKIEKGVFVQGENKAVDKYGFKVKKADYTPTEEYPYIFAVGKNLKYSPEDYSDVRGLVTADYQEYLEKEWIAALRKKYPVEIDQNVLKTVVKN